MNIDFYYTQFKFKSYMVTEQKKRFFDKTQAYKNKWVIFADAV